MELDEDELWQERALLDKLHERDIAAFMRLYKDYGDDLLIFAYAWLQDRRQAVKTVEDLFEDLWEFARFDKIKPPIYKFLVYRLQAICEKKKNRS